MNSARKWLLMLGAAALMLGLSLQSVPAFAAAAAPANTFPGAAVYISGQPQTIPGDTSVWLKFNYNANRDDQTGRTPIYLTLVNGTNSGVDFNVYTPDQIADWWENQPIGRGTAQHLDENGIPNENGENLSPDLTWVGKFAGSGTYYVELKNTNADPMTTTLMVQGDDVSVQ